MDAQRKKFTLLLTEVSPGKRRVELSFTGVGVYP